MRNDILVAVHFPFNLEHQLRVQSAVMRISKSELIRRAAANYLAELGEKNSKGVKESEADRSN